MREAIGWLDIGYWLFWGCVVVCLHQDQGLGFNNLQSIAFRVALLPCWNLGVVVTVQGERAELGLSGPGG